MLRFLYGLLSILNLFSATSRGPAALGRTLAWRRTSRRFGGCGDPVATGWRTAGPAAVAAGGIDLAPQAGLEGGVR